MVVHGDCFVISHSKVRFQATVLGTPAEEGLGGKVDLIEGNSFQDINAAVMAHPFPHNLPFPAKFALDT